MSEDVEPWNRGRSESWSVKFAKRLNLNYLGYGFYGMALGVIFREYWPVAMDWRLQIAIFLILGVGLIWEGWRGG